MHAVATGRVRRNAPDPVPVVLIGRLAVDRRYQRRGIGAGLLKDAVLRTRAAARHVGIRALLVHAIDEDAIRFYQRYGFRPSPTEPATLMVPLSEIERTVLANE
jgi:GNAT superfamily N-acetyltransferase